MSDLNRSKLLQQARDLGLAGLTFADDLVTPAAKAAQVGLLNGAGGIGAGGQAAGLLGHAGRMAMHPAALNILKAGTGLAAVGGVLGAADVIAGPDSFGNKAMDAAAMGIGGFLGAAGGPVGIAAGAGIGKTVSDATQWLFGDKKTAEQRKLEAALAALGGGF